MSQVSLAIRRAQARTALSGLGLVAAAVEPMLRERAGSSGLFRAGCDEIAGELSNATEGLKGGKVWPRHVRAAIDAMAEARRPDGRPFILWDSRLCVGYFVGHQTDERPRNYGHACAREAHALRMTSCAPVLAMLDELEHWLDPDVYERKGKNGKAKSETTAAAGETVDGKTEPSAPNAETHAAASAPPESESACMVAALREHLPALPLPEPERMAPGTPLAAKLAARWRSLQGDPERTKRYLQALGKRLRNERLQWVKDGEAIVSVASIDIICDDAVMRWLRGVQERARAATPRPPSSQQPAAAVAAPVGEA